VKFATAFAMSHGARILTTPRLMSATTKMKLVRILSLLMSSTSGVAPVVKRSFAQSSGSTVILLSTRSATTALGGRILLRVRVRARAIQALRCFHSSLQHQLLGHWQRHLGLLPLNGIPAVFLKDRTIASDDNQVQPHVSDKPISPASPMQIQCWFTTTSTAMMTGRQIPHSMSRDGNNQAKLLLY
jgi:hypothetical protein